MIAMRPAHRGFTLIELIAVITVLGILMVVAAPKFFDYAGEAKASATKGVLGGVRAGINNYFSYSSISGTATYPALADLNTTGNVMQDAIPENPYDGNATVVAATEAEADARTVVAGGGWAYYTNGTTKAIFYANTDTGATNENTW